MFLEHQGVPAHERVAADPEEHADPGDPRHELLDIRAEFGRGQRRARKPTDQTEQAHPQSEADKEPPAGNASPGEVQPSEQDEDPAESCGEPQDGEHNVRHNLRLGRVRGDVLLIGGPKVVNLSREEERRGEHGQDDGIPMPDLPHPPPGTRLCHRHEATSRRILMAFPSAIGRAVTPALK